MNRFRRKIGVIVTVDDTPPTSEQMAKDFCAYVSILANCQCKEYLKRKDNLTPEEKEDLDYLINLQEQCARIIY